MGRPFLLMMMILPLLLMLVSFPSPCDADGDSLSERNKAGGSSKASEDTAAEQVARTSAKTNEASAKTKAKADAEIADKAKAAEVAEKAAAKTEAAAEASTKKAQAKKTADAAAEASNKAELQRLAEEAKAAADAEAAAAVNSMFCDTKFESATGIYRSNIVPDLKADFISSMASLSLPKALLHAYDVQRFQVYGCGSIDISIDGGVKSTVDSSEISSPGYQYPAHHVMELTVNPESSGYEAKKCQVEKFPDVISKTLTLTNP